MARSVPDEIAARLRRLPAAQQRQALAYVEVLERAAHGAALTALAGSIPPDELAAMAAAIEAGCERVDAADWQNAWRAAHVVALALYRLTDRFPPSERQGLTSQLRRAGVSVAANIAEGVAQRGSTGEFRRFLDIAIGSLSEISYLLRLAVDLGPVTPSQRDEVAAVRTRAARLTWGLYRAQRGRTVGRATVGRSAEASPDPRGPPAS